MTTVVLVHGWGFDASLWDAVRPLLAADALAVDLGFFGGPEPAPDLTLPEDCALAVGHSLGGLWLALERPDWAGRLVLINGFARFTAAPDLPDATPPRMVERMARRLGEAPAEVVDAFRARCGAGPAERAPDAARLAWGLDLLRHGDARPLLPRATLAGDADPIVPTAMTTALLPAAAFVPGGGHLLPLTHPQAVAAAINEALT